MRSDVDDNDSCYRIVDDNAGESSNVHNIVYQRRHNDDVDTSAEGDGATKELACKRRGWCRGYARDGPALLETS